MIEAKDIVKTTSAPYRCRVPELRNGYRTIWYAIFYVIRRGYFYGYLMDYSFPKTLDD